MGRNVVGRGGFWLLLVFALSGCGKTAEDAAGSAEVFGALTQAVSAREVTRVTVTVSAPDMPGRTERLDLTQGAWGGVLHQLPAGTQRTFLAQAFGAGNTLLYEGSATGVAISAGQTTVVAITLQQVNAPPPFQNAPPVIGSLVATPNPVEPGGTVTLTASATDPNAGDTLSYAWTAPQGSFASASSASTAWTAPAQAGTVPLTLTVTDSRGAATTARVLLTVRSGRGSAVVNISLNTWPQVTRVVSTPSTVAVGQAAAVSATATDADGDTLGYAWSASCAGTWVGGNTAAPSFTPTQQPAGATCPNCTLTVQVSDGRGGTGTGTFEVCVGEDTQVALPPDLTETYQSVLTAVGSGGVTLRAVAVDPQGSALSFAWQASTGTLGTPSTTASGTEVLWTAPACITAGATPTLRVTATNALGLSSVFTFTVGVSTVCGVPGNTAPQVTGVTGAPSSVQVGQAASLTATATDAEGGVLSYAWSASCAGTWTGVSTAAPQFTPSETPGGACPNCTMTVQVSDGRGGTGTGTFELCVTAPPAAQPPVVTSATPQTVTVAGGGSVTLSVVASDPQGSALGFAWQAGTGTLGTPSSTGTTSEVTWTAPACVASGPSRTVVMTVTNALGQSRTYVFTVTVSTVCPAAGWTSAGDMLAGVYSHTATLLQNGKVLVSGGAHLNNPSAVVEIYDPAWDVWALTGHMEFGRGAHTATLLPDGKVLAVGGFDLGAQESEVYDPMSGTWSNTGTLSSPRVWHTATLLPHGRVLVVGGNSNGSTLATAELYDPVSGVWTPATPMASARERHTATLLPSGKVLVAGGYDRNSSGFVATAELYNPASGTWSSAGTLPSALSWQTATLLPNGKVLVAGGNGGSGYLAAANLYDPGSGTWSSTSAMSSPRGGHAAVLLSSGKVLVAGGASNGGDLASAEVYDPTSGTWSAVGSMAVPRRLHHAVLLPSGSVLISGGCTATGHALGETEIYTP